MHGEASTRHASVHPKRKQTCLPASFSLAASLVQCRPLNPPFTVCTPVISWRVCFCRVTESCLSSCFVLLSVITTVSTCYCPWLMVCERKCQKSVTGVHSTAMLSGGSFWRILGLNAVIWTSLPGAVTKECLKRDVLGHRENNVYSCDHPVFTECCEHQGRFTCCEPVVDKSLKEQLQLWGMIAAMLVVGAMIYTCVVRDGSIFEAETLKEAVRKKLRMRNATEERKPLVGTSPLPELHPSLGYQWKATRF